MAVGRPHAPQSSVCTPTWWTLNHRPVAGAERPADGGVPGCKLPEASASHVRARRGLSHTRARWDDAQGHGAGRQRSWVHTQGCCPPLPGAAGALGRLFLAL